MPVTTEVVVQPTQADLDNVIDQLQRSWTATLTVRRQGDDDIGYREIYLSLDGQDIGVLWYGNAITREIAPGPHELKAHNTLNRRSVTFTANVGEHVRFLAINRPSRLTYSALAMMIGFLGAGPMHVSLTREPSEDAPGRPPVDDSSGGAASA